MNTELILKYLLGECSSRELEEVKAWVEESNQNRDWLLDLKVLWDQRFIDNVSRKDYLDRNFNDILRKIEVEQNNLRKQKKQRRLRMAVSYAVAASLISFVVLFFYNRSSYVDAKVEYVVESVSTADSIRRIQLPDNSIVWLGVNSKIEFLPSFAVNERRVVLEGEAYFDVEKDVERPFRVQTNNYVVKVLGTKFNVKSYDMESISATTLFSGKVVIENDASNELLVLTPGQKLSYSKSNKQMQIEVVPKELNESMLSENNYITFKSASIASIVERLRYAYGAKIDVDEILMLNDRTYSGVIQLHDSLESVLDALKTVISFDFVIGDSGGFLLIPAS